jgi:hypothetical protein
MVASPDVTVPPWAALISTDPAGGPRPAPGVEAALAGGSVALVRVVAPSDGAGVIELSVTAAVEPPLDGVVPAPLVMSAGLAALVGESEPDTTLGSEAGAAVVGAVAATGAAVETPLTLSAPAAAVEVATGAVCVATEVTVWLTGTSTVVVVVLTVVAGALGALTVGCAGAEALIGALDACVDTAAGAGLEIGALVAGADPAAPVEGSALVTAGAWVVLESLVVLASSARRA